MVLLLSWEFVNQNSKNRHHIMVAAMDNNKNVGAVKEYTGTDYTQVFVGFFVLTCYNWHLHSLH